MPTASLLTGVLLITSSNCLPRFHTIERPRRSGARFFDSWFRAIVYSLLDDRSINTNLKSYRRERGVKQVSLGRHGIQATGNAAAVGLATTFLALAALFQLADGAQGVCTGMLRGVHATRIPMVLALLGYWAVELPGAALMGFVAGLGSTATWLGLAFSLLGVAVSMTWRWVQVTGTSVR